MSCAGVGVVADSRSRRVGGCSIFDCFRGGCCRGRMSEIREAESDPMVDVDLVPTEGQVDAGAQVGKGWSQDRKVSHEAEGSEQIGICSSHGVDECWRSH